MDRGVRWVPETRAEAPRSEDGEQGHAPRTRNRRLCRGGNEQGRDFRRFRKREQGL